LCRAARAHSEGGFGAKTKQTLGSDGREPERPAEEIEPALMQQRAHSKGWHGTFE
jgi:hypothetical protein